MPPYTQNQNQSQNQNQNPNHKTRVIFLALTISASTLLLSVLLYFIYLLFHSLLHPQPPHPPSQPIVPHQTSLHKFAYKHLKSATNSFSLSNLIGKGGSGTVYLGTLPDGNHVAVKKLDDTSIQADREFHNEWHILASLNSPFIVKLTGYCFDKGNRILVYEYLPNRTLQDSLFNPSSPNLDWPRRFQIVLDVACALEFLHAGCDPPIIHGDIKPSNVLLDSEYRAKVSDFGLSRAKDGDVFSQEFSGNLAPTPNDVEFTLGLRGNSSVQGKEDDEACAGSPGLEEDEVKKWAKDWWWKQDGNGEPCSRDYVAEWIGSQICPAPNRDEISEQPPPENPNKRKMKMREWWKEEHLVEVANKRGERNARLKRLRVKLKRAFNMRRRKPAERDVEKGCDRDLSEEFSFRVRSNRIDQSGDLFSRELSSTTSMRGTLCYVAPEYGGFGNLMEKSDIYSLGVLILVIVSGRRPLHVLSSPMKLEKANLVSWCKQLAHGGNILEVVDERLSLDYDREQAGLCISLALACLQKVPELRPDIVDIVKILKGEMDIPQLPFEFSPSPPSKLRSKSRRKHKVSAG